MKSTMARRFRRARELGASASLFYGSWRSDWRRQRGRASSNLLALLPCMSRPWRGLLVVSGGGGPGSLFCACLAESWWRGEASGEGKGAREGGMQRGSACPWRARRPTSTAWPCRSCRTWASRAHSGQGVVVHLSTNGDYRRAQGTKGSKFGKVVEATVERREEREMLMAMAGMVVAWHAWLSPRLAIWCDRGRRD